MSTRVFESLLTRWGGINSTSSGDTTRGVMGDTTEVAAPSPPDRSVEESEDTYTETLGLVSRWGRVRGYIAIHDPNTGEWAELPWKDAPEWAQSETFRRTRLYKAGNRRAYQLTAREMERIWKEERTPDEEGITEEHPVEEEV